MVKIDKFVATLLQFWQVARSRWNWQLIAITLSLDMILYDYAPSPRPIIDACYVTDFLHLTNFEITVLVLRISDVDYFIYSTM